MAAKFEMRKTADGQFMFNLKAGNGEIILTSETYKDKSSATGGIQSVRKNGVIAERYERKMNASSQPFFVLKASNGQTIGKSESYTSNAALENGIASVMKNAPLATVSDMTLL
jgi:uncharacterized protein YegP (UPF0339 family)